MVLAARPPASSPLRGARIGRLIRNSDPRQIGNWSSVEQDEGLALRLAEQGAEVVPYDEQGTSGSDLSKRKTCLLMLADVDAGRLQGIAAYDVKRLTREEFGIDGGVIARRLVEARAVLITYSKTYELWKEDDLLQFQFQCMIAGIDVRGKKRELWRGIFARALHEAFFLKAPIGYAKAVEEGVNPRNGRAVVRKVPVKDPLQAPMMLAIEGALDECLSLGQAAARLNAAGHVPVSKKAPTTGKPIPWTAGNLRRLLDNPVYHGRWEFGYTATKKNTIWEGYLDRSFRRDVPELAYWERGRVLGWTRKFAANATGAPAKRHRAHDHPLRGVLACKSCGRLMVAAGQSRGVNRYWCPIRHDRARCAAPQTLSERLAMAALEDMLPAFLDGADWLLDAVAAARADDEAVAALERQVAVKAEQVERENDAYFGTPVHERPKSSLGRIKAMEDDLERLRGKLDRERSRTGLDERARATYAALLADPTLYREATPEERPRILALLATDAVVETTGYGASARSWLASWSSAFTEHGARVMLSYLRITQLSA